MNIFWFKDFVVVLSGGFRNQADMYAPAFQVAKLFAVFMGLIAIIPVKKQMSQEEYADQFVDMMEKQKVLWAVNNAKGAKAD